MANDTQLLRLLQLTSPSLPVGAYSYSEGLETLTEQGVVRDVAALRHWIEQELRYGAARIDGAIALRCYRCRLDGDLKGIIDWNRWLTANRETEELRFQSLQMGRSLWRLVKDLEQDVESRDWLHPEVVEGFESEGCHFAVLFGLVAALWEITERSMLVGYLYSWMSNLIAAGIKLIPLGQTAGQQLLLDLSPELEVAVDRILALTDEQLWTCGWGLAIASMSHETQYSRLFRS
jgi:urease accessory protein